MSRPTFDSRSFFCLPQNHFQACATVPGQLIFLAQQTNIRTRCRSAHSCATHQQRGSPRLVARNRYRLRGAFGAEEETLVYGTLWMNSYGLSRLQINWCKLSFIINAEFEYLPSACPPPSGSIVRNGVVHTRWTHTLHHLCTGLFLGDSRLWRSLFHDL